MKSEDFTLRAPAKLLEVVRQHAAWRNRSMSAEVREHCEVGVALSMAALLRDPEFLAELQADRPELDVDAYRREVEAEARSLQARAYGHGPTWALSLNMN